MDEGVNEMTIECYFKECPKHSIHGFPEDGPFCYEYECSASEIEIKEYQVLRMEYLRSTSVNIVDNL